MVFKKKLGNRCLLIWLIDQLCGIKVLLSTVVGSEIPVLILCVLAIVRLPPEPTLS